VKKKNRYLLSFYRLLMTERDDAEKFLAYINIIFNIIVVNLSLNYMQSV